MDGTMTGWGDLRTDARWQQRLDKAAVVVASVLTFALFGGVIVIVAHFVIKFW
jgi:hypothetical protein